MRWRQNWQNFGFCRSFLGDLKRFALVMLSDRRPVLSVCDVGVLWPNDCTDQDETWQAGRPRPWPHCVRGGPRTPSPKGHSPNFQPISVIAKLLDGSRCHLVGRRPRPKRHCVRWPWGAQLPLPKKGVEPPIVGLCLLWPNGWMYQDATWYGGRPRPRPHYRI